MRMRGIRRLPNVVTHFWFPHKKYKKIHIKKYIRKEKNRSEKRMLELP
jgi:hypothetical protein